MTRLEAMHKLLAVEPERMGVLILATGWPAEETRAVVHQLVQCGAATYINADGRRYYSTSANLTTNPNQPATPA